MAETLTALQDWYQSCCDGEWEHRYGMTIQSLDNPGWLVTIDLTGTPLADRSFTVIDAKPGAPDWMHCSVQDTRFRGAGGLHMLDALLRVFLDWARENAV